MNKKLISFLTAMLTLMTAMAGAALAQQAENAKNPAAQRATELIRLIESGNRAEGRKFMTENYSPDFLNRRACRHICERRLGCAIVSNGDGACVLIGWRIWCWIRHGRILRGRRRELTRHGCSRGFYARIVIGCRAERLVERRFAIRIRREVASRACEVGLRQCHRGVRRLEARGGRV